MTHRETLTQYRQTVEDFSLYPGLELDSQQMDALRTAAGAMSAKMRAVRIVAASTVSKRDLEQRLVHKGEDNDVCTLPTHLINKVLYINLPPTIGREEVARCYLEEFHGE